MKHLLLFLLLWKICNCYSILDQLSNTISSGEPQYYTLSQRQVVIICLLSTEGDADIYVSRSSVTKQPDFDNSEYSSSSTGIDVLAVPFAPETGETSITIGIHGHFRYDESHYTLYILTPSESEVRTEQIWEFDHESLQEKLIIDIDPLWLTNDPELHRILAILSKGETKGLETAHNNSMDTLAIVKDWLVWSIFTFLKVLVEILA